jgi:hypothetical protein
MAYSPLRTFDEGSPEFVALSGTYRREKQRSLRALRRSRLPQPLLNLEGSLGSLAHLTFGLCRDGGFQALGGFFRTMETKPKAITVAIGANLAIAASKVVASFSGEFSRDAVTPSVTKSAPPAAIHKEATKKNPSSMARTGLYRQHGLLLEDTFASRARRCYRRTQGRQASRT